MVFTIEGSQGIGNAHLIGEDHAVRNPECEANRPSYVLPAERLAVSAGHDVTTLGLLAG
jgi:hypothetical protein